MSEPNFFAVLSADTAVAGVIGSRIYPGKLPQNPQLPAVVVQRVGATRARTYCATERLVRGSYQFDIYAKSATERQAVSAVVASALLDFRGLAGDVPVKDAALTTDFDSVDPEPGYLRRTQLWDIWYVE